MINDNLVRKVSLEGRTANNLMFMLFDILETLQDVSEKESEKAGLSFDKNTKQNLLRLKYAIKDLRKRTNEIDINRQYDFGEDSDRLLKLMLLSIDKTGEDNRIMDLIINFAEGFKNNYNLKLNKFGL